MDVYAALGIPPAHVSFIDRWNLRGRTMPLDKLTPKLIRRAEKRGYELVIIDPIYKVLTGDENSASEMAAFCNLFDRISRDCGCAIVYCHHHSKGSQGDKRSMDRASGSGVFARDPDALIDLLPLDADAARGVYSRRAEAEAMVKAILAEADGQATLDEIPIDARLVPNELEGALAGLQWGLTPLKKNVDNSFGLQWGLTPLNRISLTGLTNLIGSRTSFPLKTAL